ncbi:MAG: thiamine pyrophosphate-binding protein [Chlamydiales bacterium]|nr:thiamine pyrophosphate-binding protein [Chlamydiales bacterium]
MTSSTDNISTEKRPAVVGNFLLDRLFQYGVRHIFGIPGDYVIRLNKLIDQHPIEFINTTRENTAGYMADAYGRIRGMGVACITYGVGINIANSLSQAYVESSPMVVISGAAGTSESERGSSMHHLINQPKGAGLDTTQLEVFQKMTVAQAVLTDPKTAPAEINRVLQACLRHKKPVYIEFPRNVVEAPMPPGEFPELPLPKSDPEALREALEEASSILENSQRPLIWAGHDVHIHGLAPSLLLFAERHGIPIVSTLLGKTVVSEKHPLFVGVYQGEMSLQEVQDFAHNSDCGIILGVMLSDVDTGMFTAHLYDEKKIIATPSGITIGYHYYPDVLFEDFMRGLATSKSKASFKMEIPSARNRLPETVFKPTPKKRITVKSVFDCLQSYLTGEHFIVTDVGDCLFGATDLILDHNSFLASAYFATLGFGTPGAVSAQLAAPDRRVIGIIGDGAFQMNGMELSTAVRYYLDPVIIVLNNHGYGTERPLIEGKFNDILNWNYTKIPDVLGGGTGYRATTEAEFDQALKEALNKRGAFSLIEVDLDTHDFSPAMQRFIKLVHNRI